MHNLYYLDLAYEALPEDIYNNKRPFNNVKIVYKKEIKPLDDEYEIKSLNNKKEVSINNEANI